MDPPGRPCPAPNKSSSRIAKAFKRVIQMRNRSNPAFCLLIPQEKIRCCESHQFEKEDAEEAKEESKNRAAMEAFVAKLFATISAVKAAYAELQMAQLPYNNEAIHSADQAVVDELKALSELKYSFLKRQIDSSPPHVTLMLAEIQEQQALMKTYEITMKKMQGDIENKDAKIANLEQQLQEIVQQNKGIEKKLNASGSFSILDNVSFSDLNPKDFILVLHYALRSIRNFVKLLIREMVAANWDIEAAASAIQGDVAFINSDHKAFAFESFVCREIFAGFNDLGFSVQSCDQSPPNDAHQRRVCFFEQFRRLRAVSADHFLKLDTNSSFWKFLKSKYLQLVHPKMEFSFSGNLNQRKMVNSGEFPDTDFFKTFAEMGRRVWLLHCLALSFNHEVSIFLIRPNSKFSQVYMEAVTDGGLRVAFTVVPGFRVGQTVVQSHVYLFQAKADTPHTNFAAENPQIHQLGRH